MSAWRFRPPPWAWLLALPLAALLATLGTWQLRRGQDKELLRAELARARAEAPAELDASVPPGPLTLRRVRVRGTYEHWRQLLLDNQSHGRVPGYRVWTPLRTERGLAIVDRGWIAQNPDRSAAASLLAPAGVQDVEGYWRPLPQPGLRLDGTPNCPSAPQFPLVVSYPTAAELACALGEPVADGLLLLAPDAGYGYVRDWEAQMLGVPPERHYGYAAQWYALCATLLVLFVKLNLKRAP
ncbi:MAG: SURF1 family protein [Gammaproteobacteria bacterium]|nr:SURF1 family protein [Gammaproteobacteria bacterium]